ncbi:MAG: DUF4340 domain-containing protein [Deltaproteobacteria bacterium]|nr:DUF4340 domain-containing protein [Deltaproteobacteria bacterium]
MKRSILVYGLLLSASLFGAWRVWTSPAEVDLGENVVVLSGAADELERVHYHSDKLDLVIEMRTDELGRYGWVRAEPIGTDTAVVEPEAEPENPHAPPKDDGTVSVFKAGKSGTAALEGLMPFKAKRELTGVTDDKLKELGLGEPEATLEITRAGREPASYEIGGNVYGGANVYVRDTSSGKVYVVVQSTDAVGQLEDVFGFAVRTTDRKQIHVTVSRGYDENGEELWYAKSEHTRGLVKLQKALAAEVAADLANVLDAGSS